MNNLLPLHVFLKDCRIKAGLSQNDVAKRMGYSNGQFISNWERATGTPSIQTLRKLADLYRISSDRLFAHFLHHALTKTEESLHEEFFASKKKRAQERSGR